MPQDNSISGRVGNRVWLQSLLLTGQVYLETPTFGVQFPGGVADPANNITLLLVYFATGSEVATGPHNFLDIFEASTEQAPSPRLDPPHPFRILWRRNLRLEATPAGAAFATTTPHMPVNICYTAGRNSLFSLNERISINLPTVFRDNTPSPSWGSFRTGGLQFMGFYGGYNPTSNPGMPWKNVRCDVNARLAFVPY